MKKVFLVILYSSFLLSSHGQTAWVSRSDFPGCPRYAAGGFAIGNKIYIAGGICSSLQPPQRDTWEYDIISDTWSQKDSLPYGINYPGSFAINNKGYLFGGYDVDSSGNPIGAYNVFEYDPLSDNWSLKNFLPVQDWIYNKISFSIDSFGYTLTYSSPAQGYPKYSPQSDTWSSFPIDPNIFSNVDPLFGGSVSVHDNKAYLFGGNNAALGNPICQHSILIFDADSLTWNYQHDISAALFNNTGIDTTYSGNFNFYKDSVIYFGLGTNRTDAFIGLSGSNIIYFDLIFGFDLRNDSLSSYASFPYGASAGTNYFEVNGRYFLICGDGGMAGNKVVEFFPDSLLLLSVNSNLNENNFTLNLFPNPAHSWIKIQAKKIKNVLIFDLKGKGHYCNYTEENDAIVLKINELEDGVYVIKIILENDNSFFKKLIKM